jgi:DNA-binding NarL/FixJ family response regulator
VTYRADELTRRHPLHALLPVLVRESATTRLDLRRLATPALRELLIALYQLEGPDLERLSIYLQAHSEGNPFFAGELLRALEDQGVMTRDEDRWQVGDLSRVPVPTLVRQVIDGRLERLAEETRRLLQVAAVIGQVVPLDIWQQVDAVSDAQLDAAIEEALEARLLEDDPDGGGVRFPHALIREALYERTLLTRRRGYHRRAAEILAAQARPNPDMVADHFARAGDPRAAGWLLAAGERALALYSPREAIARLTRALELPGQLDPAAELRANRARARAFETVGEFPAAQADHETTLELARAGDDQQAEWQALLDLGMLWASRDYTQTGARYQQALELARELGDRPMVARTLNFIGNWQANMLRPDEARRHHDEALAIFQALGDRRGIAETLDFLGIACLVGGDLTASHAHLAHAIVLFRELDHRPGLASALANSSAAGCDVDGNGLFASSSSLTEALRDAEASLGVARDIGWRAGEAYALMVMSQILRGQGNYGPALVASESARAVAEAIGHQQWLIQADWAIGVIYLDLLTAEEAQRRFEAALARARQINSPYFVASVSALLISALTELRQFAAAKAALDDLLGATTPVPTTFDTASTILGWSLAAELALATDEPARALEIVDTLVSNPPGTTADRPPVRLALARGQALGALGRVAEAEAVLRAAIRAAIAEGRWSIVWRLRLALGSLHVTCADREAAERELGGAQSVVDRLASSLPEGELRERFVSEASGRVAMARQPMRTGSAATPAGLSSRELEVLRLLVDGRSDREIAAALFISHHTVMRHVSSILGKLGVESRTAAATHAVRERLV